MTPRFPTCAGEQLAATQAALGHAEQRTQSTGNAQLQQAHALAQAQHEVQLLKSAAAASLSAAKALAASRVGINRGSSPVRWPEDTSPPPPPPQEPTDDSLTPGELGIRLSSATVAGDQVSKDGWQRQLQPDWELARTHIESMELRRLGTELATTRVRRRVVSECV